MGDCGETTVKQQMKDNIRDFFNSQLSCWHEAKDRYDALRNIERKNICVDGFNVIVQYNPARKVSTAAKTDSASIAGRKCFLCSVNRPTSQKAISAGDYEILVNPFPIAPFHLTLPSLAHKPQSILETFDAFCEFIKAMPGTAVFYNGPECGASAPDHLHFQAVEKSFLPIVNAIDEGKTLPFATILLKENDFKSDFANVYSRLKGNSSKEPKVNLIGWSNSAGKIKILVIPRKKHRPSFYGDGENQMLVSPASIDLGGVFVTVRKDDFDRMDAAILSDIYREVCFTPQELEKIYD